MARAAASPVARHSPLADGQQKKGPVTPPGHQTCPGLPLLFPLPEHSRTMGDYRYTLVLDIDECLVRAENVGEGTPLIITRPGLAKFMSVLRGLLKKGLEVVLWTSASQQQAHLAWKYIDPTAAVVSQIIWRSSKWVMKDESGQLVDSATGLKMKCFKDLSLLGRDVSRCILVDNAPQNLFTHQKNAILIDEYHDPLEQKTDASLYALGHLMTVMLESGKDVPVFLSESFYSGLLRYVRVQVPGLPPLKVKKLNVASLLESRATSAAGSAAGSPLSGISARQPELPYTIAGNVPPSDAGTPSHERVPEQPGSRDAPASDSAPPEPAARSGGITNREAAAA
eukprot:TRINITY_DN1232_c0_g1_i1.p1 TRINITY_DN1232_c0_g1~~TRINITY_DN1232_c0_g1_i1.p1  ORF type:complete len:378 (+),score=105.55 TRINITY_DN1232_c0_g1_i1:115-1134(+)